MEQFKMDEICDIKRYFFLDVIYIQSQTNRCTLKLRMLEQGYNQERGISIEKSTLIRNDAMRDEAQLKRANPIYRLFYGTLFYHQTLTNQIKDDLKNLGVCIMNTQKGNQQKVQWELITLVTNLFNLFLKTQMNGDEALRAFVKSVIDTLKNMNGYEMITYNPSVGSKDYYIQQLSGHFYEVEAQLSELLNLKVLKDEIDFDQFRYEYNSADIDKYQDPQFQPFQPKLRFDLHDPDFKEETFEDKQVSDQPNYFKEFYEKFEPKLLKKHPEFLNLVLFDILKDLCDKKQSTIDLEQKFYELLGSVSAATYLCQHRKEIVQFLYINKFFDYKPKKAIQQSNKTNHQLLEQIGIDVKTEGQLGLKKQHGNQPKEKQKNQVPSFQQGLVEFNPEEFVKMDQSKLVQYFPTSTKSDKSEFTYIRIDPLPKKHIPQDTLVPISSLPEWAREAFEGTNYLNTIQSKIFKTAFQTDENILVCAPTGAGKTNIALLTILQELSKRIDHQTKKLIDSEFKIVYISPMKALAAEIVDKFSKKLRYLGVRVKEFTGDMQLSRKELQETQIILTTPEKWDVITRKSNQISEILKLLIIDEVHLLNDERGPILECVVARTVQQVYRLQKKVRLVGLSATLPNYWDVAVFLECHKDGVFYFEPAYRPVPLCQKFVGVKEPLQLQVQKGQRRRNKKDIYNEQAYETIKEVVNHKKQVLVFVHSRNETMVYSQYIIERAQKLGDKNLVENTKINCGKVQDTELRKTLPYGVAFHHAGMFRADRNLVERLFLEGQVKILIATATLAWGVNLPAFAVIIKGTDVFDASMGENQNLSVLDVSQMFGRAGRPQYDDKGEASLITDHKLVGYYMSMLNNASYIESKLLVFLKEALNAEIVLGNITNYNEAYSWINNTFLALRLRRNPRHYGVISDFGDLELDCDQLVHRKIEQSLIDLDELKMVRYDVKRSLVVSTELGRIASHYYIKCDTMKILCDGLGLNFDQGQTNDKFKSLNIFELLQILAKAKEFEVIRLKPDEDKEIQKVFDCWSFQDPPIVQGQDDNVKILDNFDKVIGLINGYIENYQYENHALHIDTNIIIQNSIRLCRCMFELALKKNQAHLTFTILKLCKYLENRISDTQSPIMQLSKSSFKGYNTRKTTRSQQFIPESYLEIISDSDRTLSQIYNEDNKSLQNILNVNRYEIIDHIKQYISFIPQIELKYQLKPIAATIVQVNVTVNPQWQFHQQWHMKQETFWVFVDDGQEILHSEEFQIQSDGIRFKRMNLSFFVPYNQNAEKYYLTVESDRWIMREEAYEEIDMRQIMVQEEQMQFTELLDLQPLPITALGNPDFESMYKFKYFNPIQTQVFFALYQTDENILIGAPTGSGKTYMAELAMLRLFKQQPTKKVVYIAPMKAIAKERLKDWTSRLVQLKKVVLELTGDFTPDLAALMGADVLITTPEKWDGISRNWSTRGYVKQSGLIIFDEIHLLGQDRGPVLEVIVSRMNFISSKGDKTRMVGLSTAMANGIDVSNWFGVKQKNFFNFKPSCRPVPVTIHFNGFSEKAYCPRMATMNKPAYNDIKRYSDGKPVIIFVSSRRQTRLTGLDLISLALQEGNEKQYILCPIEQLLHAASQVEDDYLKQTLQYGIGMHHSGLNIQDRQIVENLFQEGKIQLLIATSTVAWGVNFPARLVIVKGTEFYDPKEKKYVDFPVTDLLQMIGRAGRPQFDNQATACVYVEQSKKNFYRKYLNSPFPIESCLLTQLSDHVNAEIHAKSITNSEQFIDWITWTYYYRRLVKNPNFYDVLSNDKDVIMRHLIELVNFTIDDLKQSGVIEITKNKEYKSTYLGQLAAFYYIKHLTIDHFQKTINNNINLEQILRILAYAKEFDEVPVRHNEDNYNASLAQLCPLPSDKKAMDSPNEKTYLLLQAHIFNCKLPIKDYETDTKLVLDSAIRLIHCMIDFASSKNLLNATKQCILLMQLIVQGMPDKCSIINNLPNMQRAAKYDQIKNIKDLLEKQNSDQFNRYLKQQLKNPNEIAQVQEAISQIPKLSYHYQIKDNKFNIQLQNINQTQNQRVKIQKLSKVRDASWWIIISSKDKIVGIKKAFFQTKISKDIQLQEYDQELTLHIMSDSYIGLDIETNIK